MRGLIADDHPLMREALTAAVGDLWPNLALDQACDYPSAWIAAQAGPDFCLVDLDMPGAAPLDGLAGLRARAPNAVLLVFTGLTDAALLQAVRESGVTALFSKNTEAGVLIDSLRAALPDLNTQQAARLPPRQQEVLGLLAEGLTNKEIAIRLQISPATVKIHVARVMGWLGAVNRTDAVARAQRARMI